MQRSFTDRVFAGVCGGLGTSLPILTPWTLRLLFVALALASNGLVILAYVALWWSLPQESLLRNDGRSVGHGVIVLIILSLILGSWVGDLSGSFTGPDGQAIYWEISILTLSTVFLLRQIRG